MMSVDNMLTYASYHLESGFVNYLVQMQKKYCEIQNELQFVQQIETTFFF